LDIKKRDKILSEKRAGARSEGSSKRDDLGGRKRKLSSGGSVLKLKTQKPSTRQGARAKIGTKRGGAWCEK